MEVIGTVFQVLPVVTGQGKKGQWAKQDVVLETEGQYPKKVCISIWGQDKINKYDLEFGMKVKASINLESREHNGRWFTEITAWKIENDSQPRQRQQEAPPAPAKSGGGATDDLPF
jgi:hypothetical protein